MHQQEETKKRKDRIRLSRLQCQHWRYWKWGKFDKKTPSIGLLTSGVRLCLKKATGSCNEAELIKVIAKSIQELVLTTDNYIVYDGLFCQWLLMNEIDCNLGNGFSLSI